MKPGLAELKNAVVVPHIASASKVINSNPCIMLNVFNFRRVFSRPHSGMGWNLELGTWFDLY